MQILRLQDLALFSKGREKERCEVSVHKFGQYFLKMEETKGVYFLSIRFNTISEMNHDHLLRRRFFMIQ